MHKKAVIWTSIALLVCGYIAGTAGAEEGASAQTITIDTVALDTGWTLIAAVLGLFW
jgi:Na+/H+-dicarboxylate symporter